MGQPGNFSLSEVVKTEEPQNEAFWRQAMVKIKNALAVIWSSGPNKSRRSIGKNDGLCTDRKCTCHIPIMKRSARPA